MPNSWSRCFLISATYFPNTSLHLESSLVRKSKLLKCSPEFFWLQSKCTCYKWEWQTVQGYCFSRSTKLLCPKLLAPSITFDSQHSPYPISFPKLLKVKSYITLCGKKIPEGWSCPCYCFSSWKCRKWWWWKIVALVIYVNQVTATLSQFGQGRGQGLAMDCAGPPMLTHTHKQVSACLFFTATSGTIFPCARPLVI